MGLNVGGIYVKAVGGLGHDDVLGAVREYWLGNGAKESKEDPLGFEPLGLEKTGKLLRGHSRMRSGAQRCELVSKR